MLERMRWGYTREAYLDLVQKTRRIVPDVGIGSDFLCGFCGETEEEHEDTLSLIRAIGYDVAYMFAYSMREKTQANRNHSDDVPEGVKQRRITELIEAFRETTGQCYDSQLEVFSSCWLRDLIRELLTQNLLVRVIKAIECRLLMFQSHNEIVTQTVQGNHWSASTWKFV